MWSNIASMAASSGFVVRRICVSSSPPWTAASSGGGEPVWIGIPAQFTPRVHRKQTASDSTFPTRERPVEVHPKLRRYLRDFT